MEAMSDKALGRAETGSEFFGVRRRLTTDMIVKEDVDPQRVIRQLPDLGDPFLQLVLRVAIVVAFFRLLVVPPLLLVAPMKAHIADRRGDLSHRRRASPPARLIHRPVARAGPPVRPHGSLVVP